MTRQELIESILESIQRSKKNPERTAQRAWAYRALQPWRAMGYSRKEALQRYMDVGTYARESKKK